MYDRWQSEFQCLEVAQADLPDHARVFNKKSSVNWGTRTAPGPTLNVIPLEGRTCTGIAFRFDDSHRDAVLARLMAREGKGFELLNKNVVLADGTAVSAVVPLYLGRNVFDTANPTELAMLAVNAAGTSGRCRDYIDSAYQQLQLLGIEDPAVSAVWKALQKAIAEQR
ncbi:MAG: gamma-glutamylcyclotransferase [Burkholderiales bacterium]|nr:gamma-glutamylcyclotransferase [Burkholderiales bacterium]